MIKVLSFFPMKIASPATPEDFAGHMWPVGHGVSTTVIRFYQNKVAVHKGSS